MFPNKTHFKNDFSVFTKIIVFIFCTFSFSFAQKAELEASKNYAFKNQEKLKISTSDIENMQVSSSYISPTTGWFHVYYNQTYQSVEVYNGILNMALKDGHLINAASNFIENINAMPVSVNSVNATSITPLTALIKAAEAVKLKPSDISSIVKLSSSQNITGNIVKESFKDLGLSKEAIDVKLYWLEKEQLINKKNERKLFLVWNVVIQSFNHQNVWNVQVDASSGDILIINDDVIRCNFGSKPHTHSNKNDIPEHHLVESIKNPLAPNTYNVFNYPLESPSHGVRTQVSNPYALFAPSGTGPGATNGWHHDGTNSFTDTRGNNVYAQEDTDDNDTGGIRPSSATLEFDYPYTLGLNTAAANQNASITNLFYWNNLIHDALWRFGFDETAGNFQTNNMSRGGQGNDHVFADAQDGGGTDNANFYTPSDGSNPRMQMYIWNSPSTYQADSDFDNAVIAHEYGHGWSIRLTGGPSNVGCLQNTEQGGEGWSDYLGLMLTTNWSALTPSVASANIPRGIGTYVLGEPTSGLGIRPYPYSYNMAGQNAAVTYAGVANSSTFSQPHGIGSIWATMLWDMTWEIILQDNLIIPNVFNTTNLKGNAAALKLVNEGLRLQPCSPSFVQARDAILAADQALFAGRYYCAIGKAFARRGLGLNATTGSSTNDRIVTQDFTPFSNNPLTSATSAESCSGTAFTYTATSNVAGTTFAWTRAAVAGIGNSASSGSTANITETLVNLTLNPIEVVYDFILLPNNCSTTTSQSVKVIVNPVTTIVPVVGNYNICQNMTVPAGQGLQMSSTITTNSVSGIIVAGTTFNRPYSTTTGTYSPSGTNAYFKTYSFVAPSTGTINFNLNSFDFDPFLAIYATSFNPASPATNLISADDDSGLGLNSTLSLSATQGTTYIIVATTYSSSTTGAFDITSSVTGFGNTFNWYTLATGGSPIASGSVFNPVGVAGSGIPNTVAAISKNFYVADSRYPNCRATTTFNVTPASISPTASGSINQSTTVCAIFNDDTLRFVGPVNSSILGWELSTNNFQTKTTVVSSNSKIRYKGLVENTKYRVLQDQGSCQIAYSAPAKISIVTPVILLNDTLTNIIDSTRASLAINSRQKILPTSNVKYQASRKIELEPNFEVLPGSTFLAEIKNNNCYIPVVLQLQPDSLASKDTDVSSAYQTTNFSTNKYLVPFAWNQFGSQEIRRSLIKFDLSSIPANAIIDSAFVYFYFSQKMIQDNPPFTGHFGNNAFEIKNITETWNLSTVNWANQPQTTTTDMVVVPQSTTATQDYPRINITNLVKTQLPSNFGFQIKHVNESPYIITSLTSGEEQNPAKRPKIIVYYRYL